MTFVFNAGSMAWSLSRELVSIMKKSFQCPIVGRRSGTKSSSFHNGQNLFMKEKISK